MNQPQSILKQVKSVGGRLWIEDKNLRGRFPKGQRDPQLEQQIKTYKADIIYLLLDKQVKEKGWAILKSGEAYELVFNRYEYFRKGKKPDGEPCQIHTIGEQVVYLFLEENDNWTAWYSKWNGQIKTKERNVAVNQPFDQAFKAAMKHIYWEKKRIAEDEQKFQRSVNTDLLIKPSKKPKKEKLIEEQPNIEIDQINLFK